MDKVIKDAKEWKEEDKRFKRPQVTVDIIVFTIRDDDLKVLLIKRKGYPFIDYWAIPGGFIKMEESLDASALRKLKEETGVMDVYLEQLYTFGDPKRDIRGRIITVAYYALADEARFKVQKSIDETKWHSAYSLPKKMAFDHEKIISYALERIRNKVEYTTIAFQLLPDMFTLTELQKVYEIILNKKLDKRNFRKKMKSIGLVVETNETKMEGAHRPARLYTFSKRRMD